MRAWLHLLITCSPRSVSSRTSSMHTRRRTCPPASHTWMYLHMHRMHPLDRSGVIRPFHSLQYIPWIRIRGGGTLDSVCMYLAASASLDVHRVPPRSTLTLTSRTPGAQVLIASCTACTSLLQPFRSLCIAPCHSSPSVPLSPASIYTCHSHPTLRIARTARTVVANIVTT